MTTVPANSAYVGFKKQTSERNSYSPEGQGCACFQCTIGTEKLPCNKTGDVVDHQIGSQTCCGNFCPQLRICVPPDPTECDVGLNDTFLDPFESVSWQARSPNLACKYDAKRMNSLNVITKYRDLFGRDNNWKVMMEKLCATETNTCTVDPLTGKPFEKCSNMNSVREVGDQCRIFYYSEAADVQESVIQNYCAKHPFNEDCKCAERALDPQYRQVKPHIPFNDGCWYPPCLSSPYLRPPELVDPTCPSNICQIVFDNLNNNNVDIRNNQNAIDCKFNLPNPPPPPPPPPPSSSTGFIVGSAVLLLLLVVIVVAAARRTRA